MMSSLSFRQMQAGDIDGVLLVEQESFTLPWSRKAFEAEIHENELSYYLVIEDAGTIVGYAGFWLVLDEAHVTNIAVCTAYRGQGLGEKLVRELVYQAKLRGATSMTLEVRVSNIPAQRLYEKIGFVNRGIRRQYYSDTKEDAMIMWLDSL